MTWSRLQSEAPELARSIEGRFRATKHHVLASLRRDGSPRVSGTEVDWFEGDLVLGSMPGAAKARDLQRDGRFALHANPGDGSMEGGDAKLAGVAHEVTDDEVLGRWTGQLGEAPDRGGPHLFRLDLHQAVLTSLHPDGDRLVIETWHPGRGVERVERR